MGAMVSIWVLGCWYICESVVYFSKTEKTHSTTKSDSAAHLHICGRKLPFHISNTRACCDLRAISLRTIRTRRRIFLKVATWHMAEHVCNYKNTDISRNHLRKNKPLIDEHAPGCAVASSGGLMTARQAATYGNAACPARGAFVSVFESPE